MILLTPVLRYALRANATHHRAAQELGDADPDPVPVVKFFNPVGAGTWLATELDEGGDVLFGLADLGFGCPELGYFSLGELGRIRLPFGLGIERDISFDSRHPLSAWAEAARRLGSIQQAEQSLWRLSPPAAPDPRPAPAPLTAPDTVPAAPLPPASDPDRPGTDG